MFGAMGLDLGGQNMRGPYRVAQAGHWLVQETPELVHQEMLEHLKANAI